MVQSGADGAGRNADDLGDLGRLESDKVAQHDDRALLRWQTPEATFQLVARGDIEEVVRRLGKVHWEGPDRRTATPFTACLGDARSDQESMQPRVEAVRIAESGQVAPGDHQCVLNGILGPIDVAEDPLSDRKEAVAADANQVGVCLPIAATSRLNEIAIHPHRPWSALSGAPVRPILGVEVVSVFIFLRIVWETAA